MEVGLCLESCLNPVDLVDESKHLVCPGVHRWFSMEYCTDDPPQLQLIFRFLPSRDGINLLPIHEDTCVCEILERSFPQDFVPVLRQHG